VNACRSELCGASLLHSEVHHGNAHFLSSPVASLSCPSFLPWLLVILLLHLLSHCFMVFKVCNQETVKVANNTQNWRFLNIPWEFIVWWLQVRSGYCHTQLEISWYSMRVDCLLLAAEEWLLGFLLLLDKHLATTHRQCCIWISVYSKSQDFWAQGRNRNSIYDHSWVDPFSYLNNGSTDIFGNCAVRFDEMSLRKLGCGNFD
jgi:hypothetical protein